MSKTILRKSAGINRLKNLLNEPLMSQEFYLPASRGYKERNLMQVELLFQLQQRDTDTPDTCYLMILIVKPSDEKSQKTIPDCYFNEFTIEHLVLIL